MNDNENGLDAKVNYLRIFIIISTILILISIAFPLIVYESFPDWTTRGTFGDSFGALNSLFSGLALSGVVVTILLQRTELSLQRTELKETRKEFLLNRTTNLVYAQLDRFENAVNEFTFHHNEMTYKGNDTILFLDNRNKIIPKPLDKPEDVYNREMKESIIDIIKLVEPNKSQIEKFAHYAGNSVDVLGGILYNSTLNIDELNHLKNLFFFNIGFINLGVIEMLSNTAENELEFLTANDYEPNGISVGSLIRANIFLNSIKEFKNLNLTKENFVESKIKWKKRKGLN